MISIASYIPANGYTLIKAVPKPDTDEDGIVNIMQGDEPFYEVIKNSEPHYSFVKYVTVFGTPDFKEFKEGKFATIHNSDISGYWQDEEKMAEQREQLFKMIKEFNNEQ